MVAWLPADSMVGLLVAGAAKAVSGVPLHSWDTVQVACYTPGMFFEWHKDTGTDSYSNRLWTAVVELQSAPGGGLEVFGCDPLDMSPGDLVLFPAAYRHRATPPTDGIRFSLTVWLW